ncbi:MAG: hypothetical protein GY716_13630 [bacterium]|nr:hypothetical protein [bacterium]
MPSITDAKAKRFLASLEGESKEIVETLLATMAMQSEAIDDLLWKLEIYEGGVELRRRVLAGASLAKLAAKLSDVDVSSPSLEEVSTEITKMQNAIASAADAQRIFTTILKFGMKVAPLVL